MKKKLFFLLFLGIYVTFVSNIFANRVFTIGQANQFIYSSSSFSQTPGPGDTIKILSDRHARLQFQNLIGSEQDPIVIINSGGKVRLKGVDMPAMLLQNCKYIKVSGKGDSANRYGIRLVGPSFGLSFEEYSSNCEAEFIELDSCSNAINAKKDFYYNPPVPYPVFKNLAIHDNYINHSCESMYIGETKSPGMEFRHVRIYNNVILNSGRESFQIANCVEDVEVYNNFCYNSGLDGEYAQTNNSQLGGNSIGKFYNNIFINAPTSGVIVLGKGDMYVQRNYFLNNTGIFSDDRYFPIKNSIFKIEGNYFRKTKGSQIAAIWNKYFDIYMNNNKYDASLKFLDRSSYNAPLVENTNNIQTTVDSLLYTVQNGIFTLDQYGPSQYMGMGPVSGLSHIWNNTPVLDSIPDVYINIGDTAQIPLHASTLDNDNLTFSGRKLPAFISIIPGNNGNAFLRIDARNLNKQVDSIMVMVKDASHGAITRQTIRVSVKSPVNTPPSLNLPNIVSLEAATKIRLNISGVDAEKDSLFYTFTGLPYFVKPICTKDSAILYIKPTNINAGNYTIIVKAEDGFSIPAVDTLNLVITPSVYNTGKILYRVNYGGGELEDTPINWQYDMGNSKTYEANYSLGTGADACPGANNTGAPNGLFGAFRYNGVGMQNMLFEYPCEPGRYEVNLFFAERVNEVYNNTIETFSVYLEDSLRIDSLNTYKLAGNNAVKKSLVVDVRDQSISLKLCKQINNAKLNGIEIKFLEKINLTPTLAAIQDSVMYEGATKDTNLSITDDAFPGCDSLAVAISGAPSFASLHKNGSQYTLHLAPDYNASGIYPIKISVSDCEFQVSKTFNLIVKDFHTNPPFFVSQSKNTITEGITDTITVTFNDPDNDAMTLIASDLPAFAQFTDLGKGSGRITFSPGYSDAGNYGMRVTAKDEFGFTTSDSIAFNVLEGHEVVRIPLTQAMINDWVTNGSSVSPKYLVDEQSLDPRLNQHPTSSSWLPAYNLNNAPYYVGLNLGKKYAVKKVLVHDMNNGADLTIDYGKPNSWTNITTYNTSNYNYWKTINTDIVTQYIRLGEATSVSAYINEIAIYGYEINNPPLMSGYQSTNFTESVLDTLLLTFTDPDNDSFAVTASNLPSFASLLNGGSGTYLIVVNPTSANIGSYTFQMIATDSNGNQSVSDVTFAVVAHSVERIVLNSSMVVDLVKGGSSYSPVNLVNEQTLDPLLNQHPTSYDWYPAYNLTNAPFHVYLNLGKKYVIKKIYFHDINNSGDMAVSYGTPAAWTDLFTFTTSDYLSWRKFDLNITTQYVRLSQYNNNSAKVNEIALYGYEYKDSTLRSATITPGEEQVINVDQSGSEQNIDPKVYPNPVRDVLNIQIKESRINFVLLNQLGIVVKEDTGKQINVSDLKPGLYLLKVKDRNDQELFQSKVLKVD